MTHLAFSRRGGKVRSVAKTTANRAKARAFWKAVRAEKLPSPRRPKVPPTPETIAKLLAPYCRRQGIIRLEAFGSIVRGEAKRGSDVDLLVTFSQNPGLKFFTMADDMSKILGAPVHLLTRASVEQMPNPYRRISILADAKVLLHA